MYQYLEINRNGRNIRCKIYCHNIKNISKIVIFCHGFGGHKDNGAAEKFANRLIAEFPDAAMVTFNWPCHGDDVTKRICLAECDTYLEQVIDYIKQEFQTQELYSYATSFGGYLTLKYISEHGNPFKKVALRCPAVNMYDVITTVIMSSEDLNKLQQNKVVPVGFDRKILIDLSFLEELRINDIQRLNYLEYANDILILHGVEDEVVPFKSVYAFAQNNQIEFVSVEGADHRFQDENIMNQAIKEILDFYLNGGF